MSIETVRAYFKTCGREGDVLEFPVSSATVELAAQALGVIPAAGSPNSAIELSCAELEAFSHSAGWVDVCKEWG